MIHDQQVFQSGLSSINFTINTVDGLLCFHIITKLHHSVLGGGPRPTLTGGLGQVDWRLSHEPELNLEYKGILQKANKGKASGNTDMLHNTN